MSDTIPNVYNALVQLPHKEDLRQDLADALLSAGYPPVFKQYFVPGSSASSIHMAIALCISVTSRQQLVSLEELKQFDHLVSKACAKWSELHKPNKASRILTDYLG